MIFFYDLLYLEQLNNCLKKNRYFIFGTRSQPNNSLKKNKRKTTKEEEKKTMERKKSQKEKRKTMKRKGQT